MKEPVDPATNEALPSDAIQRVLFICHPVHVYAIPPLKSMKGHKAADWTGPSQDAAADGNGNGKEIFVARLRVMETAIPVPAQTSPRNGSFADSPFAAGASAVGKETTEKMKTDILLEDPSTGALFAAAPYTSASAVEQTIDSSRFFALRVVGDGGRKAMLGIGFEDRSQSFDFGVTLQDARKVLGFANKGTVTATSTETDAGSSNAALNPALSAVATAGIQRLGTPRPVITGAAVGIAGRELPGRGTSPRTATPGGMPPLRPAIGRAPGFPSPPIKPASPKNYSLKPGQTISVNIRGRRPSPLPTSSPVSSSSSSSPLATPEQEQKALFSLAPPPPAGSTRSISAVSSHHDSLCPLPPPPSGSVDRRRRPPPAPSASTDGEGKLHEVAFPTPPPSTGGITENEHGNTFDDDDFGDFQ
ncbi:hypothetical protein KEM56_007297 [Ascosphaera pollenicola]|nr:hypothetical protein KEM56_007297 [Ascosphaera pollenicola]